MRSTKLFGKFTVILIAVAAFGSTGFAQRPEPRQEKLLNGLKLLMWPDDRADKVWLKVRIHSGSAFDPQGKEGSMRLLADSFFPNENARDFFTDDLGGDLQVLASYDYIQVSASAKPDQFLTLLETVAAAVSNPTIDKETTARLRAALLAKVKDWMNDPQYVADRAVAQRLLGNFPYGRPLYGTPDSVPRIDFADLIGLKQRFLTADNATVAIAGNFDRALAFRAARRYFGSWLRSDKAVPSTFRQPEEPGVAVMSLPSPSPGGAAVRFALRGVARSDRDLAASLVFTKLAEARLRRSLSNEKDISVRNEFRTLPGLIVIAIPPKLDANGIASVPADARQAVLKAVGDAATEAEFREARGEAAAEWAKRDAVTFWLDADTYKIANVDADMRAFDTVSLSDLNNYIQRAKSQPLVSIVISAQPARS